MKCKKNHRNVNKSSSFLLVSVLVADEVLDALLQSLVVLVGFLHGFTVAFAFDFHIGDLVVEIGEWLQTWVLFDLLPNFLSLFLLFEIHVGFVCLTRHRLIRWVNYYYYTNAKEYSIGTFLQKSNKNIQLILIFRDFSSFLNVSFEGVYNDDLCLL